MNRAVARQEQHGLGHVLGLDPGHGEEVAGGSLGDLLHRLPLQLGQAVVHRRVDAGGVERDDAHAVRRQLQRPRFRQPDEPVLAGGVVAEPPHPAQPGDGRVVDDHPRALAHHHGDHAARHQPGALQVDVHHRVPLVLAQLVGEAVGAYPGVVEEDVDAPEALHRRVDRVHDRRVVAHVAGEGQRGGAGGLALGDEGCEVVARAHPVARVRQRPRHVERGDAGAGLGQRQRGRPALPVRGARHERHPPAELTHARPPLRSVRPGGTAGDTRPAARPARC